MRTVPAARLLAVAMCVLATNALGQTGKAPTAAKATLLLASDVACTVKLDGEKVADLLPDEPKKVAVVPGEHLVSASTPDGQRWSKVVSATGAGQTVVKIDFGGGAGGGGGAVGTSAILFMSDAPAVIEIDGKGAGEVGGSPESQGQKKISLPGGRHVVRIAAKEDPRVGGEFDVRVEAGAQEIVRLTLAEKLKGLKSADAAGLKWVRIPAGDFTMGCSPADSECDDDEKPAHFVKITKAFAMAVTETTVAQFRKYAEASATKPPGQPTWSTDAHPVVNVTWDESAAFCKWAGGRLPTEAEAEYAARGGSSDVRYGPLNEVSWYADNAGNSAHPVGLKMANAYALSDILGNVWEWTADWYSSIYYQSGASLNPVGPRTGEYRVLRGGSWNDIPRRVRASFRYGGTPASRFDIGFRCLRDASSPVTVSSSLLDPGVQGAQPPAGPRSGIVRVASAEGLVSMAPSSNSGSVGESEADQEAFEGFRRRKEAEQAEAARRETVEAEAARQRVAAQEAADREEDRAFRNAMIDQIAGAASGVVQAYGGLQQVRRGDLSSVGVVPSTTATPGAGAANCPPIPSEWSSIQTPEVKSMAQPSNVGGAIQRAGSAAAALSAARGWLSQAQSDLRDSESQFASTCRQIGTGASACQVFYTPNATTMLDASRNQLVLSRDQVAYTSGMVSALQCHAR
jgi:formylglycine-generating enzyme required for sulfatase activity